MSLPGWTKEGIPVELEGWQETFVRTLCVSPDLGKLSFSLTGHARGKQTASYTARRYIEAALRVSQQDIPSWLPAEGPAMDFVQDVIAHYLGGVT